VPWFNGSIRIGLQVDIAVFWMSGKDGLEAVVASGLSTLGAALENRESIVKAIYGNGILLLRSRQRMNSTSVHLNGSQCVRVHHDVAHR
jgi:hypothetical protein